MFKNNKNNFTRINISIDLKGEQSKLFDFLLELNAINGKMPKDLAEFIFLIGLEYVKGMFEGMSKGAYLMHQDLSYVGITIDDIHKTIIDLHKKNIKNRKDKKNGRKK